MSNLFVRVGLKPKRDQLLSMPISSLMLEHPSIRQTTIKIDRHELEVGLKIHGRLSRSELATFKHDLRVLLCDEDLISEG